MQFKAIARRLGLNSAWTQELALALLCLAVGFALIPIFIYFAGAATLGRYDGASVGRIYDTMYHGLQVGSAAAWLVFLGPYLFYLLFKVLRASWRAGAKC